MHTTEAKQTKAESRLSTVPTGERAAMINPFEPANLAQAEWMADRLSRSTLVPQHLQGKPLDVFLVMMRGHDLGLSAAQSIAAFYVVNGRVGMYADVAVGVVKRQPSCEYFRLIESNDTKAVYEAKRVGNPSPTRLTYTFEQAQKAGLEGNANYKKNPAAMLRARCSMALARIEFPDVLHGIPAVEEFEEKDAAAAGVGAGFQAPPPPASSAKAPKFERAKEDAQVDTSPAAPASTVPPADPPPKQEAAAPVKTEPAPAAQPEVEAKPEQAASNGTPSPKEQILIAIEEAQTTDDMAKITARIVETGIGDDEIRAVYKAKMARLKGGAKP